MAVAAGYSRKTPQCSVVLRIGIWLPGLFREIDSSGDLFLVPVNLDAERAGSAVIQAIPFDTAGSLRSGRSSS